MIIADPNLPRQGTEKKHYGDGSFSSFDAGTPPLPQNVTEVQKDRGANGRNGTNGKQGTQDTKAQRNTTEDIGGAHPNYEFFVEQSKQRNLDRLIAVASPAHAAEQGVSPEFHYARLLRTQDTALQDGKTWMPEIAFERWFKTYHKDLGLEKTKEVRMLEFLTAFSEIKLGYGESPLSRAGARAKRDPKSPQELINIPIPDLQKLACICRSLALDGARGDMRFFLGCRDAAALVGSTDHMHGYRLLGTLCASKVLKVVKRGTPGPNGKATRYQYIASDAGECE